MGIAQPSIVPNRPPVSNRVTSKKIIPIMMRTEVLFFVIAYVFVNSVNASGKWSFGNRKCNAAAFGDKINQVASCVLAKGRKDWSGTKAWKPCLAIIFADDYKQRIAKYEACAGIQ